ncbi:MAG: hypothetical protein EBS06_00730 [Proteobacteria bacterium]|nr:hypothetical protein [Pseudomonadota bacterium]
MTYKIPKLSKKLASKASLCLTIFAALILGSLFFLQSKDSLGTLSSCKTYSGTKNPGVNCVYPSCSVTTSPNPGVNCLPSCSALTAATSTNGSSDPKAGVNCYYLDLPLCSQTSSSVSVKDSGLTPSPRANCADLIDMPLCNQLGNSASAQKNCVNECNQTTDILDGTTGHNITCVRFCDKMPDSMTPNPRNAAAGSVGNCIYRKCHQLDSSVLPTATNCTNAPCNTLVPDELDESRMQNDSDPYFAKYCEGDSIKCYSFTAAQLPYVRYRSDNTMCQIHNCKPATTSCGRDVVGVDDTLNISNNVTSLAFSDGTTKSYPDLYSTYINLGLSLSDTSICNPVVCKPIIYTPHQCLNNGTTPDPSCDTAGGGSVCATTACIDGQPCLKDLGQCYKTVDCNIAANASTTECTSYNPSDGGTQELSDDTNSWFYRPQPLNKAYKNDDPSQGYRITGMCYGQNDLKNQSDNSSDDHKWGVTPVIPIINVSLHYFHMQWGPNDRTRSPKMCNTARNGWRGAGYIYLCGNKGNIFKPVSSKTAFYNGYVNTEFDEDGDTTSTINVCLRFKNALRTDDLTMSDSETCGSRECAISCAFGLCKGQMCGYEVCKDLTVKYSDSKKCSLNNNMFLNNNDAKDCAAVIDNFLRVRAVQYGHQICAFLDSKGQVAYNNMFFDENRKLNDGVTCISGSYNSTTGNCDGGKNSNDDKTLADRWRTILKINYTEGNTIKDSVSGFYDKNGKFIAAQECVKVPLNSSPPDLYNLANANNSLKLFSPPLFIRSANDKRGGTTAQDSGASTLGTTDFLYPEIVVQFGTTTKTLSMGPGYSGYEVNKDPLSYAYDATALTTVLNGLTYSVGVLIKKEVDSNSNQPKLCLYQRISSNNGFSDIKIGCVNRTLPEIDNRGTISAQSTGVRFLSISGTTANANVLSAKGTYGDPSINLKYCYNTSCSNSNVLTITNLDPYSQTCSGSGDNNLEKYKVCAKREECSKLWKECMENEIDIQNNGLNSNNNGARSECQSLAINCNAKKGISSSESSIIDQINSDYSDPNAYGWFNELCITSGFDTKLKQVYNAITTNGSKGKCKLDANSPASCNGNGNAAIGCNCLTFDSATTFTGYSNISRTQTYHEAGLCIDIPTPKICSAIKYGADSNNASSLNGTAYTDYGGIVKTTHRDRNNSIVATSLTGGHGEYPSAIVGMNNVAGTCNGFWKSASSNGSLIFPKMNCVDDSSSTTKGKWSGTLISANSCVRYSCPAITTGRETIDSDSSGNYTDPNYLYGGETSDSTNETSAANGNTYGITYNDVTLGSKGASNGYAVWSQFTKTSTSDFSETNSPAAVCIAGFSASTLPTRKCNQLGSWSSVTGSCIRKTCPAINPPYSPSSNSDWAKWSSSKGATFGVKVYLNGNYPGAPVLKNGVAETHTTPASRKAGSQVTVGSTRKGYCNTKLGFFQALGGSQPEADCLSDGTWSEIRNPCVTSCNAITNPGSNDGNATWTAVTNVNVGGSVVATGTCISGYSPYPYSALKDSSGNTISPTPSISKAAESAPTRSCQSVTVAGGTANVWTNTSSSCVNKCPGYDTDTREGIGQSSFSTSQYGKVAIRWNSISAGTTDIQTIAYNTSGNVVGSDDKATQTATDYSASGRTNGKFIVTRYCNTNYKWSDPVIQCATNAGTVNNSRIGTTLGANPTTSTILSSFIAADKTIKVSSCSSSNYGSNSMPVYKCQKMSSNSNIDQYYYALSSGTACSQITCSLTSGANYGSGSYYSGPTTTVNVGSSPSTLNCKSGYGHAFGSGGSDSTCGVNVTDRISASPTMTCINSNGVGTWSVSNDCLACRSCNDSSKIYSGDGYCLATKNNRNDCYGLKGKCPSNNKIEFSLGTLSHGSSKKACQYQNHDNKTSGIIQVTCKDGQLSTIESCGCGTSQGIAGSGNANWLYDNSCPSQVISSTDCT